MSYQEPSNITEICNQVVWNNLFIAPQGKPLFNSFFIARNMLKVIYLLSDSGSFLSWHMVKVKYQLNNTQILSWLGLINSIPLAWKTKIKYHFSDSQHIGTDSMRRNTIWPNLSVKQVYRELVKPLINPPTVQKSPEQYLGKSGIDWEEVYLTPLKITIESQLRVFQYKILNNVLYLNNRLFKMGYAESPLCSLCKRENETVSYIFAERTRLCHIYLHLYSTTLE